MKYFWLIPILKLENVKNPPSGSSQICCIDFTPSEGEWGLIHRLRILKILDILRNIHRRK
jgi:hypothetical protein